MAIYPYMGCFNITTLQNFDANRIFDLTHYSIWDLVLWWYDIDLIIFDFFLDFFNCISFLLIFINTFFYNIFFNFLNFTITLNYQCYYHVLNQHYITFLFFYIFFFFNIVLNFLFFYFEIFFFFDLYFTMDTHIISITYTYMNNSQVNNNITCFFYFLFFLFLLFFYVYIYIFAINSIFSILCDSSTNLLDIMYTITNIPLTISYYFNIFYIINISYIINANHNNTFFFLSIYNLFLLILFSLVSIFFLLQTATLNNHNVIFNNINIQLTNQNNFFFRLENVVLIAIFNFINNEIINYVQINLINFLINFFSYIINDITYLNSIIYYYFSELFFSLNSINSITTHNLIINTQLIFLNQI